MSKKGAQKLKEQVVESMRGQELADGLIAHFNELHSQDLPADLEIEKLLLIDGQDNLTPRNLSFEQGVVTFNPSSASKCERELFYKAMKVGHDEQTLYPYQRRWTRNGTAVHAAVQRDLLYAEKYLANPRFRVLRTNSGKPAWERNLLHVKRFDHNGVRFQIYGMMDGVLVYKDGSRIGFEFKTKSTTIAAIGNFKLKTAQAGHIEQCIAYSLLFGIKEFIILYESLAKDNWTKGVDARADLRAFYLEVTERDQEQMLDKFAKVASLVASRNLPPMEEGKCIFCPYKSRCLGEAA